MSGRARTVGVTRQDAESLAHVRGWLAAQPNADPLALGVLDDVAERVAAGAHSAAIVRVRLKNRGNPQRAASGPLPERPGALGQDGIAGRTRTATGWRDSFARGSTSM
jgi:hypothetical protein